MLRMVRDLHARTGLKNLVMAGGVALNCVANGRIVREGPFENLWVQPAAGDAGSALGAALFVHNCVLGHPRRSAWTTPTGARPGPTRRSAPGSTSADAPTARSPATR
jgi:predicted NodU family carbamoyl transferase